MVSSLVTASGGVMNKLDAFINKFIEILSITYFYHCIHIIVIRDEWIKILWSRRKLSRTKFFSILLANLGQRFRFDFISFHSKDHKWRNFFLIFLFSSILLQLFHLRFLLINYLLSIISLLINSYDYVEILPKQRLICRCILHYIIEFDRRKRIKNCLDKRFSFIFN